MSARQAAPAASRREASGGRSRRTFRALVRALHGWVGLAAGLVLVVLGLSGSVLVFSHEIDRALAPELMRVAPGPERVPFDAALAALREARPEARVVRVRWPREADGTYELWLGAAATEADRAYVDPYTGQLLGIRGATESLTGWLFDLHSKLLAGHLGERVAGWTALALLFLALSGVAAWWRGRARIRQGLVVKLGAGWKRANHDLHHAIGFWTAALLALSAVTGASLVFSDAFQRGFRAATASSARPAAPIVPAHPGATPLSAAALLDRAERAMPGGTISYLYLPQTPEAPFTVRKRLPGEVHPNGRSMAYLDPYTGETLRVDDARLASRGDRWFALLYPLHIGSAGGMPMRIAMALVGLAPAALFGTGALMWWNRRRKARRAADVVPVPRRRRRHRRPGAGAAA